MIVLQQESNQANISIGANRCINPSLTIYFLCRVWLQFVHCSTKSSSWTCTTNSWYLKFPFSYVLSTCCYTKTFYPSIVLYNSSPSHHWIKFPILTSQLLISDPIYYGVVIFLIILFLFYRKVLSSLFPRNCRKEILSIEGV